MGYSAGTGKRQVIWASTYVGSRATSQRKDDSTQTHDFYRPCFLLLLTSLHNPSPCAVADVAVRV